jgi:hypothetical protein
VAGQSVLTRYVLNSFNEIEYMYRQINFNYYTTSQILQSFLLSVVEMKEGKLYVPPAQKNCIYCSKGTTMPIQHEYKTITDMTIKFYAEIVVKMPPTPAKIHYLFNLRDISKVFEGICKSTPYIFSNIDQFVRLRKNECERVFHERLINLEDRNHV